MGRRRPLLIMTGRTLLLPVACLLLVGCTKGKDYRSILPADAKLRAGDVVFRRGGGLTSQAVLAADVDGNYSHVGIVVDSAGTMMIVHAVPGEPDFEGDVDRVKMDRPEHFFSTEFTVVGEVCRPRDSLIARRASEVAMAQYRRGTLFDHDYDDLDTTRMYCTELIAYAFRQAGHEVVGDERHKVGFPIMQASVIFPSDIHSSPFLETKYTFN